MIFDYIFMRTTIMIKASHLANFKTNICRVIVLIVKGYLSNRVHV